MVVVYSVGDTVVYPHHGAAVVESTQRRELDGEECDYLVLRLTHGDLTVMVPAATCRDVGIRDVVSPAEVERVLEILRAPDPEAGGNWSRRFKSNIERLRSGDVFLIAEVVRNLSIRAGNPGLSAGERRMLASAKELLYSELSVAIGRDDAGTEELVTEVLVAAHGPF